MTCTLERILGKEEGYLWYGVFFWSWDSEKEKKKNTTGSDLG